MSLPRLERVQVLVAGGGPAGSTAAYLLARSGLEVLLVEPQAWDRGKVCGEFVSAEGVGVLARLGTLESLSKAGAAPIRQARIHAGSGESFDSPLPEFERQCGLGVSRSLLDSTLLALAAAGGARVLRGARLTHLSRDGGLWSARIRTASGARRVACRMVIGADGRNSLVARLAGMRGSFSPGGIGWQLHLPRTTQASDRVDLFLLREGYAGLSSVEQDRWTLAALLPLARRGADTFRRLLSELSVQPCLRELLELPEAILDRNAAFPVRMGWRWGAPEGLFLAGDAAGFVDPFSGQGISLALLGGEACSSAAGLWLQGRTAAARLSYDRFLRRELAPRLVVAASLRRVMAHSSWTSGLLRTMRRHPELGRQLVGLTRNAGSAWLTSLPRFAGRLAAP